MTIDQGLFHNRKLLATLMQQMVQYNLRLGQAPSAADRKEFGTGLVRALAEAATGGMPETGH
jgi:hypothetical protein